MNAITSLQPELVLYLKDIDRAREMLAQILEGLSDDQFRQRPALREWSVAECIEHLNVTARATAPKFEDALDKGRRKKMLSSGAFKYSRLGRWFVDNAIDYPPRRRFKAPRVFAPTADTHDRQRIVADFEASQIQLIGFIQRADGLDLKRVKVVSPVSRLFRLSLGQYLRLATGHQLRHLHQAADARRRVLTLTSLK